MKSLMIKDLSRVDVLDGKAMAGVHGGMAMYKGTMPYPLSEQNFSFDASQVIGQSQSTLVNNGNNAAFVCGITSDVKPTQDAHNSINFGSAH